MNKIITLLLCLYGITAIGQDHYKDIHVISEFNKGEVNLRWIPSNYMVWQKGIKEGYKIVRKEIASGKQVVLAEKFEPLSPQQFDVNFPNNNAANSAKMMLYDMTINTAPNQASNLKDAVAMNEQKEGRYLFAMVAAENDYEVAKAMALGFTDDQIDPNLIYTYTISIDESAVMESLKPAHVSPDFIESALSPVGTLIANIDSDVAVLSWKIEEFEGVYSAWNIERSYNGGHFERLNSTPFMHGYTEDAYEYLASFQDPLFDCDGKLIYRVQGITPFGTTGPFSNDAGVDCVNDKLNIPLAINGSQIKDESVMVNWRTFDSSLEDKIKGFNLYRTPELTKAVVKLNDQLISKSDREYLDALPLPSAYYFLEVVDVDDRVHRSSEHFVQKMDKVPPVIPLAVQGRFAGEQTIHLTWTKNTEEDLLGYDIAIANDRNAQYIKKNRKYILTNSFSYTLNEALVTDSIFVKIRAVDRYFNLSEYSKVYAFARPDVWEPGNPILEFAYPTPAGVALGWTYSGSNDVVKHELQRRPLGSYKWNDLLIITKENQSKFDQVIPVAINESKANHLDKFKQEAVEYEYRIIAKDEAGNQGVSKILSVVPFLIQETDIIKDFKVQVFHQDEEVDSDLHDQLANLNGENLSDQLDALENTLYKANITWRSDLTEAIDGFIIYRSMPREGFKPIKECSIAEALGLEDSILNVEGNLGRVNFGMVDESLTKGYRYSYYVVAKFRNGAESERSRTITKVVR